VCICVHNIYIDFWELRTGHAMDTVHKHLLAQIHVCLYVCMSVLPEYICIPWHALGTVHKHLLALTSHLIDDSNHRIYVACQVLALCVCVRASVYVCVCVYISGTPGQACTYASGVCLRHMYINICTYKYIISTGESFRSCLYYSVSIYTYTHI